MISDELLKQNDWARRLAESLVRDEGKADDLVQEAFFVALKRSGNDVHSPRAFLATVLRRLAGRQRKHDELVMEAERRVSTERAAFERDADRTVSMQRLLLDSVDSLPEDYRTPIVMHYLEGLSAKDIGRETGLTAAGVRTRLKRGRDLLRGELDRRQKGDDRHWAFALVPMLMTPSASTARVSALSGSTAGALSMSAKIIVATIVVVFSAQLLTTEDSSEDSVEPLEGVVVENDSRAVSRASNKTQVSRSERPQEASIENTEPARPPAVQSTAPSVIGRVVDQGGKPVQHAVARLWRAESAHLVRATRTSASGRFSLADIKVDQNTDLVFEVVAAARGRCHRILRVKKETDLGDVKLDPGLSLSGRLTDPAGRSMPGVLLWVIPSKLAVHQRLFPLEKHLPPHRDRKEGLPFTSVMTDSEGVFRAEGLRRGHYFFMSGHNGISLNRDTSSYEAGKDSIKLVLNAATIEVRALSEKGDLLDEALFLFATFGGKEDLDKVSPFDAINREIAGDSGSMTFLAPIDAKVVLAATADGAISETRLDPLKEAKHRRVDLVLRKQPRDAELALRLATSDGKQVKGQEIFGRLLGRKSGLPVAGFDGIEFDPQGNAKRLPAGEFNLEVEYGEGPWGEGGTLIKEVSLGSKETTRVDLTIKRKINVKVKLSSEKKRHPMLGVARLEITNLESKKTEVIEQWSGEDARAGQDWRKLVGKSLALPMDLEEGRYRFILRGVKNRVLAEIEHAIKGGSGVTVTIPIE